MRNLLITLLLFLFVSAFPQKTLKIEEVVEKGIKSSFELEQPIRTTQLTNGLFIEVEPVDASNLDEMFFDNSQFSGKYQYYFYTSSRKNHFLMKKKRKRYYLKSEDEFLYEGLYWLLDNDEINENIYEEFVFEISLGEEENEEFTIYSGNNKRYFNPYFIDDKYLNVFKISLRNEGPTPITNNLDLQIFNGGENFNDLSVEQINSYYNMSKRKSLLRYENLNRVNFHEVTEIPGYSTINKYFAVHALNLNDGLIELAISNNNSTSKLKWEANVDRNKIEKVYKYYEIRLKPSAGTFRSYYVLGPECEDTFIVGNYLFVKESDIDNPITFFYYGMKTRKLFFGVVEDLIPSEYLDFMELKRDKVKFNVDKIDDVKRKEKVK